MKIIKLDEAKISPGHGVKILHRTIIGKDISSKFSVVHNTLQRDGKGPYPAHSHIYEHCMYVVKGNAKVTSGGESRIVEAGDFIFIPSNELHSIENIDEEDFQYIGFNT